MPLGPDTNFITLSLEPGGLDRFLGQLRIITILCLISVVTSWIINMNTSEHIFTLAKSKVTDSIEGAGNRWLFHVDE